METSPLHSSKKKSGGSCSEDTMAQAHPPSPALNREQIKNRSSRGWSGSGSSNGGGAGGPSNGLIPPLSFKSRSIGTASVAMSATLSSESAVSSTVDGGSPFGSILAKFNDPPAENTRKSSGSFKVLDKKAVSNSPFLTGGNTTSSTGSSPQTTRRPFAPNALGSSFSNGNTPSSSPVSAKHGLGLFTRSTPTIQSPAQSLNGQSPARIPHKRTNSDIENRDPASESKRLAQNHVEVLREDKFLSVTQAGKFADAPSPATQFNAEMEAIGGPQAIDVTYSSSASGTDSSPELEGTTQPFPQPPGTRRGPRPSVAALGNRGTVSTSPFLQQGLPKQGQSSALSQASSASRKGMGPREPSNPDLRAQALADEYRDDEALPRLTEAALERKASKKSVKWAEVEEVCEFDVLTEDGESRRSSAASSTNTADDYYNNYVGSYTSDDEEEEQLDGCNDEATARLQQMPGVQQHLNADEQFYDQFRHPLAEPDASGQLRREGSGIQSQQASFIHLQPGDNSTSSSSSYVDNEDNEVQRLINEVEAASLQSRNGAVQVDDVFSTSGEFGTRTPHGSSASALSQASSSKTSTPQPLRINSLSRRPLPSPPVVGLKVQSASPEGATADTPTVATAEISMLLRATPHEGDFSLPDLGLSASPLITFDELGLARKESLKRASPKMVYKKSASPSLLSQEVLMDSSALLRDDASMDLSPAERTISPRPQITMKEVRDSLKKRPNSLFAGFAAGSKSAPLTSTPPSTASPTSKPSDTPTGRTSKAISARPAPAPVKISSEELPTLRSTTPTPLSPSKEPESALDRLVREAADNNGLLHAPILNGRARSNSSASSSSGNSFQTADSRNSDGKDALKKYNDALIIAKRKAKGLSIDLSEGDAKDSLEVPPRPKGRRRSLSTGDAELPLTPAKESLQATRVPSKWPVQLEAAEELGFSQSLGKALDDCRGRAYRINERQRGQYQGFSPNTGRISTVGNAGDVHSGGAWKKGRRVSDMHEHHTLVKEIKDKNASRSKDTKPIIFMKGERLT